MKSLQALSGDHINISLKQAQVHYDSQLLHQSLILKDEESRRLRLRVALLEVANEELQDELSQGEEKVETLEHERLQLREQIHEQEEEVVHLHTDLKSKAREVEILKTELSAMGGASLDSTKILAEKLSLSRELATLRPELEHLRAQAASQQKAVAEKLALQRQLNALEVELEMAKNLTKKNTTAPVTQTVHHEAQAEIVRLRKDVAKEKKQRDATESMARREVQEWEARSSALEDKLDNMRSKLRSLQEQLKATQAELSKTKEVSKDAVAAQSKTQRGLKRKADVVETDIMLGTPGQGPARGKRARGKRNGLENVGLGEKSMFSITPYLNKTADVESVLQQPEQAADRKADPVNHGTTIDKEPSIPEGMSSPLVNATPSRPVQNAKTATTKSKSALSLPLSKTQTLAPIDEEAGSDTNNPAVTSTNVVREDTVGAAATSADPTGPKKKKRKLLGSNKTIFDEDEAEQIKRPVKTALNPLANKKFLGKKSGAQLNGLGCAGLTFSPLKRDRRGGVQASFLA